MGKRVKKPMSMVWLYCFVIISLMMLLLISSNNNLFAQDWDDEDEAQIAEEAQKDLAAFLQWSVKYRFSPNLKVGDKVEYKLVGDDTNTTDISLEVTKEEKGGVWIVEKFDGNEVHMLVDLKNMTLLDLFGFDEDGERQEPPLLNENKVVEKIDEMMNMAKAMGEMGVPIEWDDAKNRETITTTVGSISCTYLEPKFSEEITKNMKADEIAEMNETMKLYFSEDVPKLLPFEIALPAIVSSETFEIIQGGFVKNIDLEITEYIKKKR